jgi:AraC-like DNA-binding protein
MEIMSYNALVNKKSILIFIPILVLAIGFLLIRQPTLNFLLPDYNLSVYSDQVSQVGKSEIRANLADQGLKVNYTLKSGDPYPFVSMVFTKKNYEAFNSENSILNLGIDSDSDLELLVRLGFFLEGYSQKENLDSYLFVERPVQIKKGKNSYHISLDEIVNTPAWWYGSRKLSEFDLPTYSRSKTGYIALYDVRYDVLNQNRNLHISEFEIHPIYSGFYFYGFSFLLVYGLILFIIYKLRSSRSKKVLVPIDFSQTERREKNNSGLIINYIAENFTNPNLKLEDVAKAVGIIDDDVSLELKNFSGKSFKSYVNFVRVEEAKKRLVESDLQVNDIAYEVGYNSDNHFIKVFKEMEGCSPNLYRKEHSNLLSK